MSIVIGGIFLNRMERHSLGWIDGPDTEDQGMAGHERGDQPTERIPFAIRVLRAMNPLMVALLRSRLHFLASRDLLALSFRGRISGRRFEIPLGYVQIGDRLYLVTRPTIAQWWKNLRDDGRVGIHWRGRPSSARASVLDPTSAEAADAFRTFLLRNPGTAKKLYHLEVLRDGQLRDEDVRRELPRSIVVRIEPDDAEAA